MISDGESLCIQIWVQTFDSRQIFEVFASQYDDVLLNTVHMYFYEPEPHKTFTIFHLFLFIFYK